MGWDPPGQVQCPRCDNHSAELFARIGDRSDYRCSACGDFSIGGTQRTLFDNGRGDPKTGRFLEAEGRWFLTIEFTAGQVWLPRGELTRARQVLDRYITGGGAVVRFREYREKSGGWSDEIYTTEKGFRFWIEQFSVLLELDPDVLAKLLPS